MNIKCPIPSQLSYSSCYFSSVSAHFAFSYSHPDCTEMETASIGLNGLEINYTMCSAKLVATVNLCSLLLHIKEPPVHPWDSSRYAMLCLCMSTWVHAFARYLHHVLQNLSRNSFPLGLVLPRSYALSGREAGGYLG